MEQEAGKSGRFVDASEQVIGACIEVHRHLGPGLLESAYHECLRYELRLRGLKYVSEIQVPVAYKGISLDCGYRLDFLIEDSIILEIKAVERLLPVHQAQVVTYLKLTGVNTGLLVNFNVALIKQGLRRLTRKKNPSLPAFPASCSISDGCDEL